MDNVFVIVKPNTYELLSTMAFSQVGSAMTYATNRLGLTYGSYKIISLAKRGKK